MCALSKTGCWPDCRRYVETSSTSVRAANCLFWYNAVLKRLPGTRESLAIPRLRLPLNNRGLFLPQPVFRAGRASR